MSFRFAFKTPSGHLQCVLARCLPCLGKTSLRHLVDVLLSTGRIKTSSTWTLLYKNWLSECYKVYEYYIEFHTEQEENTNSAEKTKKTSFPKEYVEKADLYTRAEQNNDHKRKMHKTQCRSSFKI